MSNCGDLFAAAAFEPRAKSLGSGFALCIYNQLPITVRLCPPWRRERNNGPVIPDYSQRVFRRAWPRRAVQPRELRSEEELLWPFDRRKAECWSARSDPSLGGNA